MSTTLSFFEAAWTLSRGHALAGRRREALDALRPLLGVTDDAAGGPPLNLVTLAHRLAGRLHFNAEGYRAARRHLRAARRLAPDHAETHHDLGLAWERDPQGSDRFALHSYRRADRLNPGVPKYLAAYGRALVRNGRAARGRAALRSAAKLAPGQPEILRVAVEGLRESGRVTEAYRLVVQAKFAAPRCREVDRLYAEARFALSARSRSVASRRAGPAVLAFPGVSAGAAVGCRRDGPAVVRPRSPRIRFRLG